MRRLIRFLILVLLTLIIITCASSVEKKYTGTHCSFQNIEHKVTYSLKGTRSEAQHGHLYINGKEIPDVFLLLRCEGTAYKFFQGKDLWGKDGYFPETEELVQIPISGKEITAQVTARGWYEGREMLKGTPHSWLYAEWENGSAFVAPEALEEMANSLGLKIIPRRMQAPKLQNMNE